MGPADLVAPVIDAPDGPGRREGAPAGPSTPARPEPRVVVEHLGRSYGGRPALAGVSFQATDGVTGLLGPNGAGKTTLLRCLAGISGWDAGRISVDGVEAGRHPRAVRRRVGFMPERVAFPAEMRVDAYLRFAAAAKGVARAAREAAVDAVMTRVGLAEARSRIVGNLSKGYRQRVGLAQALVGDPAVIVLDEPTAGLDPLSILEIRQVLSACASARTVLLSTHALADARLLCDHLVVLGAGSVVYDGPASGLATGDAREVRVRLRGGDPGADLGPIAAGAGGRVVRGWDRPGYHEAVVQLDGPEAIGRLARALVLGGFTLLALEPTSDTLEEAFRQAVLRTDPSPASGVRR